MSTFGSGLTLRSFCLSDGESRSALPRRGTKSHLILQSRRQVLLVVDEEGQFGAVRSGLSSIYMIRMGLRLVQMLGKKLQADDDVVQLAFCKFSSDGSNCKEPPIPPATANLRRQQSASAATRGGCCAKILRSGAAKNKSATREFPCGQRPVR